MGDTAMADQTTRRESDYWEGMAAWGASRHQALWRAHSDAVNAALCRRWLRAGAIRRILKTDLFDEVSGEGLYTVLSEHAERVHGIDYSPSAGWWARVQHPSLRATAADVRRLPFSSGVFDAIVSNSTLDHFDQRHAIVESLVELNRVLAPGGHLILTLDNLANPVVAVRNALPFRFTNTLGLVPYHMGKTCGPRRAAQMVVQAGFRLLDLTAVMHCPRLLAVPVTHVLERHAGETARRRLLSWLMAFERCERWPTRFRTGHFLALLARKAGDEPQPVSQ